MFLFNKRTRNIIKYMWSVFAILIVLSMVFAYSGFSRLTQTPTGQQNIEIPDEVRAQLEMQKNGVTDATGASTPEEQAILDAINEGRINLDQPADGAAPATTEGTDTPETPTTPPVQELKLEI